MYATPGWTRSLPKGLPVPFRPLNSRALPVFDSATGLPKGEDRALAKTDVLGPGGSRHECDLCVTLSLPLF